MLASKFESVSKYGVTLRLAQLSDAKFIFELRTNPELNKFISATNGAIEQQKEWLAEYKKRELMGLEYYFVAYSQEGEPKGTARLYNFSNDTFEIGSWVFEKDTPANLAIKADIICREIGFDELGFNFCKFKVSKKNKNVIRYHLNYKPTLVHDDEEEYHYTLGAEEFRSYKNKLVKIF